MSHEARRIKEYGSAEVGYHAASPNKVHVSTGKKCSFLFGGYINMGRYT